MEGHAGGGKRGLEGTFGAIANYMVSKTIRLDLPRLPTVIIIIISLYTPLVCTQIRLDLIGSSTVFQT